MNNCRFSFCFRLYQIWKKTVLVYSYFSFIHIIYFDEEVVCLILYLCYFLVYVFAYIPISLKCSEGRE